MPRYRVLVTSHIGGHMRRAGDEVELSSAILPGMNLEPLDDEGRALQAERTRHREVAIPAGSPSAHTLRSAIAGERVLSEEELKSLYTPAGHRSPAYPPEGTR